MRQQAQTALIPPHYSQKNFTDAGAIQTQHRQNSARLNNNGIGIGGPFGGRIIGEAQDIFSKKQMPG